MSPSSTLHTIPLTDSRPTITKQFVRMSTDNNSVVAAAAVGNNAGNVPPEQWPLCGSIAGIKFRHPSGVPLKSKYRVGGQMHIQDLEKWISSTHGIKNDKDIYVEAYFTGDSHGSINIRAKPSKNDEIHHNITELLKKEPLFVANRHAISGSIHFGEWPSNNIWDKIANKIGSEKVEIIKRLADEGVSDYKLANVIFIQLLGCDDADGGLEVGLELLCAHHATEFQIMFVRNSDYHSSSKLEDERTSSHQLASTMLGCWQVDKQKGGVFLFPMSFVAMGVSVGKKEHEKGYDDNAAYDSMVSYLPRIVEALKNARKKVTILVENPLRFHRMPYVLRSMIKEVKDLGAGVEFMSNWGEDMISKIDGILDDLEGDDSDEDVGTHLDPMASIRNDSPKQKNIIVLAKKIAPKLGSGGQLDDLLKEATIAMDGLVSGLDIHKGGIVWSGKGGFLTKAKSNDLSRDEKLQLAASFVSAIQSGQDQLGSNEALLIWNRCTPGGGTSRTLRTCFQLDVGDGNNVYHARHQTAMAIALGLVEGFLVQDTNGAVTVADGKPLYIKTVFRSRSDPVIQENQQIMALMASKFFDRVVVKLSPRMSSHRGHIQVINEIGRLGGCTIDQSWGVDFTLEEVAAAEESRQETLTKPFARRIIAIPVNNDETTLSRDLRLLADFKMWDVKDKTRDEARKMRNLLGDSVGGMIDENSNDDDCSSESLEDKEKKPSAKTAKSSKPTFKTVTNSRGKGKTDKSIIFSSDEEADTPKPATGIRTGGRPSTRQEKARPQKKTSSKSSAKPRVKSSEDGDTSPLAARARPRLNYANIENRHASELEADEADQRKHKPGLGKLNFNDSASDASAEEEAQVKSSSSEAAEEEDYEEEESSVSDDSS